MADLATLSIKVDSTSSIKAEQSLNKLADAGKNAETATGRLSKTLLGVGGLAVISALVKSFYSINAEFQTLQASLVTVTGSTDRAVAAFEKLKRFAAETPFELAQVTQAFILLKTRGMEASSASLRAFGDMASSFSRSLTDTIQAVAQATVGEFESIKSFGVSSAALGDKVAFTFKGQTEIVKKSASEIEAYFQRLASSNFGDGMKRQMDTLGGVMSNLKDQVAATFAEIGNSGINDRIIASIRGLTDALLRLTPLMASFAGSTMDAFLVAVDVVSKFKYALMAVAALSLGAVINSWVAPLARWYEFMRMGVAAIAASQVAATGYAASATLASVASATWSATMAALTSTAGMLAIGLGALYIATMGIRAETDRLNEAHAEFQERMNNTVNPIMDLAERTREMKEEAVALNKVLAGDKTVKIWGAEAQRVISLIRKNGGDVSFAEREARKFDLASKALKDVRDKLQAKVDAEKRAAEEAKRHAEELRKLGQELTFEIETQGMSTLELENAKVARMGATGEVRKHIIALLEQKAAYESEVRVREELKALDAETFQTNLNVISARREAARAIIDSLDPMAEYQKKLEEIAMFLRKKELTAGQALAAERKAWEDLTEEGQKYLEIKREAKGLEDQVATPDERRLKELSKLSVMMRDGLISGETYRRKLLEIETTGAGAFATIAEALQSATKNMEDAFVTLATTGKASFRDLMNSIMRDLARLYAQKAFQQLFNTLLQGFSPGPSSTVGGGAGQVGSGIGSSSIGGGGSSVGSGLGSFSSVYVPPTSAAAATSAAPISVSVNVDANGGVSTQGDMGVNAKALGALVGAKVREVLVNEKRPGGLLMASR